MKRLVAVIPAAGKGLRVSPLPGSKELFPIGYQVRELSTGPYLHPKVVMQYLVDGLIEAQVHRLLIVITDNKWDIVRYYGNGEELGISISYLYQAKSTGMPGALDLARPWLREDDTILFGMPDTIVTPPNAFSRLLAHHQQAGADLSLGLFATSTPERFGMTRMDEAGYLSDFVDKPSQTTLTHMWGMGCWGNSFVQLLGDALPGCSSVREPVLSDFFSLAVQRGLKVTGLEIPDGGYLDIGTPADLVAAADRFSRFSAEPDDPVSRRPDL